MKNIKYFFIWFGTPTVFFIVGLLLKVYLNAPDKAVFVLIIIGSILGTVWMEGSIKKDRQRELEEDTVKKARR